MSMFDSLISQVDEKFNLGGKAGTLLAALLALMTDRNQGGLTGFLEKFNAAGLSDTVASWINAGANTPVSNAELESALGSETLRGIADTTGTSYETATSASGYLIPRVVDGLTPDGIVPADDDLLSRIGGYLTGIGGLGTAAAMTGGLPDRADGAVGNRIDDSVETVGDYSEGGDSSPLKWLIPLFLTGLLVVLGYWFCGKSTPIVTNTNANTNANANRVVNSNLNTNQPVNNNSNANTMTSAPAASRTLTEVSLPSGAKLQAYPGGIEDQLIKFIQSDEYKNGTADSLKDKWFNFDDLNFETGTTKLVPASKRQLDNIVAILKAFSDVKIKIGGYTDRTGNDAANKKLSDDRAKAVKAALENSGVGAQVPEAEGYGEQFATIAETASDKEREIDRKTSVRLLK